MRNLLTREQAIEQAGIKTVIKADNENCEPTNIVGYNGACQCDELTEWAADASFVSEDGYECNLRAYYYTTNDQDEAISNAGGDGGAVDWVVEGYEIS